MSEELEDLPPRLEPGEVFEVGYGNGKKIEVVSLDIRGQQALAKVTKQLVIEEDEDGDRFAQYELAEQALRMARPDITDEQLKTLNATDATEIALKTLGNQRLSEDEQKK